jgi:DNA-binding transcriptional ArsR family regulator
VDLDEAFSALADPTRRDVLRTLVGGPLRAGEIAFKVQVSPPALSRHLRVLRRAGMIVERGSKEDARVRLYQIAPHALASARTWLDDIAGFWGVQLAAFKEHAERAADAGHAGNAGHAERADDMAIFKRNPPRRTAKRKSERTRRANRA